MVVLAGCTALGLGPGSPTPTADATPDWPAELPPGMSTANVTGPLDLVRAHTAALTGTSFTYRATITARTSTGIRTGSVSIVRRVGADGRFVHRMRVKGVVPAVVTNQRRVDAYSNGSFVIIRFRDQDQNRTLVTTSRESSIQPYDVVHKGQLYSMLSVTEPAVMGSLSRGGVTYLHVKGTDGSTAFGLTEARNLSIEALVRPDGVVHRYAISYHANDSDYTGWEGRLERQVVYEDVGSTTVERPAWVSRQRPNATKIPTGR